MHATLTLLYNYHYWANAKFIEACIALTPEQWAQPLGHSWGTVQGLLAHMALAEDIWFSRILEGVSPTEMPATSAYPTLDAVQSRLTYWEPRIKAFLAQCTDDRLAADLHYTTTKGAPQVQPLGGILLHVANHGTHHRGELAAMLALLDVPHPEDDLLFYLREQAKR
jgi:uncharacterized damage-inducible protein DinB